MANVRKKDKRMAGVWFTKSEWETVERLQNATGFDNLSDFLKWAAIENILAKERGEDKTKNAKQGQSRSYDLCL